VIDLYEIPYSPWSEKARWALDHHRIPYHRVRHIVGLAVPRLRLRTRRLRGPATLPTLIDSGEVVMDSWNIALYADRIGGAVSLIPDHLHGEIARWNEETEQALSAGRALLMGRWMEWGEQGRSVEDGGWAGSAFLLKVRARVVLARYGAGKSREEQRRRFVEFLDRLRERLHGNCYLLDQFSYADIAGAAPLQFIAPVANEYIPLSDSQRTLWTDVELARTAGPLLQWRDSLYERHRRVRT
jgi:glutathione S-transferase